MTTFIALLRAVNVGGTGKLPMQSLVRLCEALGFANVRTYIQSGNVLFETNESEPAVLHALHRALQAHMGKPVDVVVRTAAEMRDVLAANPFPECEPNNIHIAFLTVEPPPIPPDFTGPAGERVCAGKRELYVYYPEGQGRSKLKLPLGGAPATARNLNTVAKLVALSGQA